MVQFKLFARIREVQDYPFKDPKLIMDEIINSLIRISARFLSEQINLISRECQNYGGCINVSSDFNKKYLVDPEKVPKTSQKVMRKL